MSVQNLIPSQGWEVLGSATVSGASSSSIITIPARDLLRVTVIVTGYGGSDIVSLRFGTSAGAVDSGNNYATAHGEWNSGNGGNMSTNLENNSTSFLRLGATGITNGRISEIVISNPATNRKICQIRTASEWGSASTTPRRTTVAHGLWGNTSSQIIAIQIITAGGQTLNSGSGFVVEGRNLT
jgi:hypothetical protein